MRRRKHNKLISLAIDGSVEGNESIRNLQPNRADCMTCRWLFFFLFLFQSVSLAQRSLPDASAGLVPAFDLQENDLALSRRAQPFTYFDKVGRKFAILGFESGTFEAWAYPLKLLRGFQLEFLLGTSTVPIKAEEIVRYISVTPEATILTYTHQSFAVKEIFVTPLEEPGAIILLDIRTTEPMTVVGSFLPVLQPMWPAGIGGQYAYWDRDMKAYLISEPTRANHAYVGSPAAEGISYTPAHMLSDSPNQFKIEIQDPTIVAGKYVPIILAGGKGDREEVKKVYRKLVENPEQFYRANVEYYASFRRNTLQIQTPNTDLNLAYEWGKVAYDNLVVTNPDLGTGLVAGLGTSGTGGRPGFGWYFGGDAYINSFSLNSYGAFTTVRDALAFTQKWQRDDGKMAHELSQAAGYIDWWNDYHYGFIHGDTTPFYIVAMYDYYQMTGDREFIEQSWQSLKKAYDWCLSTDEDGDGLMENRKAGLGALEFGALTGILSDIYLSSVWVRANFAMSQLALAVGEESTAEKSAAQYEKTLSALNEKFWDAEVQQYAYAFNEMGKLVKEVTPWSAVGMIWKLFDEQNALRSLEKMNSAELMTDWGTRSISIKSKFFEPLNYNYGAVWPFLTSWVATAQYKYHSPLQGYMSLMSTVRHTFDNALGYVTEVFSGHQNVWPQEAVAHQGFCTAGVILPLVRGMLGLQGDAVSRTIMFAPQLPADWDSVSISGYVVGEQKTDLTYRKRPGTITIVGQNQATEPYTFICAPAIAAGSKVLRVQVNGVEVPFTLHEYPQVVQAEVTVRLGGKFTVEIFYEPSVEVFPPEFRTRTGDINRGLKVVSASYGRNRLYLVLEGLSDRVYSLPVGNEKKIGSITGAKLKGSTLLIQFPTGRPEEFVRKQVELEILPN